MIPETVLVTFFSDVSGNTCRRQILTPDELLQRIRTASAPTKEALPWLKMGAFGDVRSDKGSLRHDRNLNEITGVEIDYDAEQITFDEAIEILVKASVTSIVYTSPSHMREGHGPRWRVLGLLRQHRSPGERDRLVNRLAGLFRNGAATAISAESWNKSQAYFFGSVDHNPEHRAELIEGEGLDDLDDLDLISLERPGGKGGVGGLIDEAALLAQITSGASYHTASLRLLWRWAQDGVPMLVAKRQLREAFDEAEPHDPRWQERVEDIPRLIGDVWGRKARRENEKAEKFPEWERHHPPADSGNIDPGPSAGPPAGADEGVRLEDFYGYMEQHNYIYAPTRAPWPGGSVNARLPLVPLFNPNGTPVLDKKGNQVEILPTTWLDRHQPVEQITWAPGRPMIIRDRLISEGGWIERRNVSIFNLYRPPLLAHGDPDKAGRWIAHVERVYPEDAGHIISWLAHRVQRPQDKINHALVLGGLQGIGKDSLIEPIKRAVGPWNVAEPSPTQLTGRFNGFVKSVILRISEAHDLGEIDRYQFYEHLKVYTAAPPDVLRVDEKNLREYNSLNCCGVIITTNHKTDGIYLPADDRRHYVAWSFLTKEDFEEIYWKDLWVWYDSGGDRHVAAYLGGLDLSTFNPKAPPPKTAAFWDIVNASRAPEDAELNDILDLLHQPEAVTLIQVANKATTSGRHDFADWFRDRKNRRILPHRFEACEYVPIRNPDAQDGLWRIDDRRQVIYGKASLTFHEQLAAARRPV